MLNRYKIILDRQKELYLQIKVRPQATQNQFKEVMADGALKVDIKAVPEKGRANQELISFLAKEFNVSREKVKILSGAGERTKLVKIIK